MIDEFEQKVYLGDGAYAEYDGWHIIITTSNGMYDTNAVYLEPLALDRFLAYAEQIKKFRADSLRKKNE